MRRLVRFVVLAVTLLVAVPVLTSPTSAASAAPVAPAARPRIAAFGDSLLGEASDHLRFFAGLRGVDATVDAVGGTALCDWTPQILRAVADPAVDAVVVAFSGNNLTPCAQHADGQPLRIAALGELYHFGATRIMYQARPDVPVLWVTAPTNPGPNPDGDAVRQATIDATSSWPNATVVDGGAHITPGGAFSSTQPCLFFEPCLGPGGTNVVRAPDGAHFCPTAKLFDPKPGPCDVYSSGALRYALTMLGPALDAVGR